MEKRVAQESAHKHVSGESVFVDDINVSDQMLSGRVVYSPYAKAKIKSFDLEKARALPGVFAVLSARDIPGENNLGPIVHDEPCLADGEVHFVGQAVFLIAGESDAICRQAEKLIRIDYEPQEAVLTLEQAMAAGQLMGPPRRITRGDVAQALQKAPHRLQGTFRTGAQEHWYLETQTALVLPDEDDEMRIISSTQNPSETQAIIAELLHIRRNDITVEVRRMGGAFGGKETQAHHVAAWAALLARHTRRPVKIRLFRDDDQMMTGKRHPFLIRYEVGFDERGKIMALKVEQNADGGAATDLSFAILERAMFHADNAYFIPNMEVTGRVWKTNKPSNTAFRGFGGPQGVAGIEHIIDRLARFLHKDAADIRRLNFYGTGSDNVTHYGQTVERNHLQLIYDRLMASSAYRQRRKEIDTFNRQHEFSKKGLALSPVKFGISFTTSFLNQAGALIHIYQDGTVLVSHGGTEMGQGLNTKILQIAAAELGVELRRIKLSSTDTSKVPNTSATAASTGSDLNGMAVKNAADKLKARMAAYLADYFNEQNKDSASQAGNIRFADEIIFDEKNPRRKITFAEAVPLCYLNQVSLSATGFYRTPDIHFDRQAGQGKPFHYYSFGMAVSEVEVDILTGDIHLLRTDILHDVGDSLNPAIDRGQIEGAFIQGVGWCTMEECKWDDTGHLMNHSPDTYKIPTIFDIPEEFNVHLLEDVPNPSTIRKSKAVGEPPFLLSLSVWLAIKDAISAVDDHQREFDLPIPATNEAIVLAAEALRRAVNS